MSFKFLYHFSNSGMISELLAHAATQDLQMLFAAESVSFYVTYDTNCTCSSQSDSRYPPLPIKQWTNG